MSATGPNGIRLAVDAMGGDHGPTEVVPGSLDHARAHPEDTVLLVGDPARIREHAGGELPSNVEVVPASQVIEMHEHPALALREKKDSSITVACDLVKDGRADAVMTAGHTGAAMAAAVLRIGRLPGVDRPALAVQMVREGKPFVLLDIGANPDSSPENLLQYARMGAIFAERVVGVPSPRVALLSIGEEKGKGDARIQRATELLDASDLRFVGNVEGKDLVSDHADVVVTDAVTGNVVDQVLRGPLDLHLRPVARGVPTRDPRQARLPAHAVGHRADPEGLRLRDGRRLAAPRREGRGDHHARPGPAADGRVRVRCRRGHGPDERPGSHRGRAPRGRVAGGGRVERARCARCARCTGCSRGAGRFDRARRGRRGH